MSASFWEALGENLFPCLVQLARVTHISWLMVSPSIVKVLDSHHSDLLFHFPLLLQRSLVIILDPTV